jgi:hypothetical protein
MTNFYLARPLKAKALSAAVGSGKTFAAIRWMASPQKASTNFLYVAPTIELGTQTAGNLRRALATATGPVVRNVHLINSNTTEGKARFAALRALNAVDGGEGQIVIITTQTLLDVLAGISKPELWSVILDEAFDPATWDRFGLGTDVQAGWDYFSEVFAVDPEDGYRIIPKMGLKTLVADIADGRFMTVGSKYEGLQGLAKAVANPARRCEMLVTDRLSALLNGTPLPEPKRKPKDNNKATERVLEYASYISPEFFSGFHDVLFLSALFEQTILYHLWTKALGVTFEPHPDFPSEMLRDTHGEQARFLAVGHLLHCDDTSSIENLSRNIFTGAVGEASIGDRVLDQVIRTASDHFDGQQFLLQTNVGKGYEVDSVRVPSNAVVIPAYAHGLDKFQHVNNVVPLCITNPNPQRMIWVKDRTGMTSAQVGLSFRIHTVYQALGRCSIRSAANSTESKTLLVAGAADAKFIHSLFPGSLYLGQVGTLPSMKALAAKTSRNNTPQKEDGKTTATSKVILGYLENHPEIERISSRGLREATTPSSVTLCNRVLNDGVSMSDITWTRAVGLACLPGTGWTKQGQSLIRVTAAHYGLKAKAVDLMDF